MAIHDQTTPRPTAADGSPRPTPNGLAADGPLLDSSALFGHGNQVRITHQGQLYMLRITRADKLILTK